MHDATIVGRTAHHNAMMHDPHYAYKYEIEKGAQMGRDAHEHAMAVGKREMERGAALGRAAHEAAMMAGQREFYRTHGHYDMNSMPGGSQPGLLGDATFQNGAMYGSIAGVATVLGAYFILKHLKGNKSDDFERA